MSSDNFQRKLTAILSADVVGYSRLMGEDEAATVKTLEAYKGVMFSLIKQHRGRVVDSPGDNLLAEFGSVVDAVQCAVSIQKELQTRNADLPENRRMEFRIGINLGDVIEEEDRIYGDGVNIAARLEALADPGGICISKTAFDYIENKLPFGYRFIGEQTVKNIAKPIGAYKILMETRLVDEEEKKAKTPFWRRKVALSFGIIVILSIAGILYWNFYLRGPSIAPASIEPEQETVVTDLEEAPKTIAVLPFDSLSSDPEQEYFVDGLSEEILNSLAQISDLSVIAKTSSFSFKGTNKKIPEIASELGVNHILEGSVRKAGNAIRITAQLIKAVDGSHLWSKTYDRELNVKQMFAIQEDIANSVANELKITLGITPFKQLGGTENMKAYELYLIGKGLSSRVPNIWLNRQALESFDSAIELDPRFALAWIGKSKAHLWLVSRSPADWASLEEEAGIDAALKALELEPNLGEAYFLLGSIHDSRDDYIEAEKAYRKGMELTTESKDYHEGGLAGHYATVGYLRKAVEFYEEMLRNDPLRPELRGFYVLHLAIIGDVERAEKEYENGKAMFGDQWPFGDFFINILRIGAKNFLYMKETNNEMTEATEPERIAMGPRFSIWSILREHESPEKGLAELRRHYNSEDNISSFNVMNIALLAAFFGDTDLAIEAMNKASRMSRSNFWYMWFPVMKEVRQLPRFKDLIREVGLVDYWKKYGWPDLCRPVGDDDFECD